MNSDRDLPNLLIAGVPKAATTSLFGYLAAHPEIYAPDLKELRYFTPLKYGEALGPLADYRAHFNKRTKERYAVEATPGYFAGGQAIANAIAETLPDPRVLVLLREPSDRCWSYFRFVKSRLRIPQTMTFSEYLDRCFELHEQGIDGERGHQPYWGVGGGCYSQWVDGWFDTFGDAFVVRFFDDISEDPRAFVMDVCDWLGLDFAPIADRAYGKANKSESFRSKRLQNVALRVNRSQEGLFRRHPQIKRGVWRAYDKINHAPRADKKTAEDSIRLEAFYRPFRVELREKLAERQLSPHRLPAWVSSADAEA